MRNHILFLIVVFLSNTIQAFTGFAGTMLAMPASMLLLGMERASAVLNVIAIVVSLLVLWKDHRYVQWKELLKIVLLMLAGMGVGIYLLNVVPTQILQYCYAGFIILIALKKIFIKREIRVPGLIMLLVIFAAGIIHGMFVSGGSLLVLYAVTVLKEKRISVPPWLWSGFFSTPCCWCPISGADILIWRRWACWRRPSR